MVRDGDALFSNGPDSRPSLKLSSSGFRDALCINVCASPYSKKLEGRCTKSRKRAPKARNVKARGKRERSEARRPWVAIKRERLRPERPKYHRYYALFRATRNFNDVTRGDALRFARACPWLSHCAPSALSFDFWCKACLKNYSRTVSGDTFAALQVLTLARSGCQPKPECLQLARMSPKDKRGLSDRHLW